MSLLGGCETIADEETFHILRVLALYANADTYEIELFNPDARKISDLV